MMNNGQVAWNLLAEDHPQLQREIISTYIFQAVLTKKMVNIWREDDSLLPNSVHSAKSLMPIRY